MSSKKQPSKKDTKTQSPPLPDPDPSLTVSVQNADDPQLSADAIRPVESDE